ncbi:MAG: hypothetical protein IT319_03255 [Anaerolineae bacterium]|nr:hypothetical protein [Anaerolineae bacterium]
MTRLWLLIIVIGCFAGVPVAAEAGDCAPAALSAAFTQAFNDAVTIADRALPYARSPLSLPENGYVVDDGWRLWIGMNSGSLLPSAAAGNAPQFWIFHVVTGTLTGDAPPPTIHFPQAGLLATVATTESRGARLRGGPDTQYPQVGTAPRETTLAVTAAVRLGDYDWLSVGAGNDWIRSDLVHVNLPDALTAQRLAVDWDVTLPPYVDAERHERCPLPGALMIQTLPGRVVAYDFNGFTLLQSGTTIITYDNFRAVEDPGAIPTRFFFTNVQGSLETVVPGKPIRVVDPGFTFAVDFDADGTRRYVSGFTQDEQELGAAAWVFACNAANLYDQAVADATGAPLLWYSPSCGAASTFGSLHAGWSEAVAMLQAGEAFLKEQYLSAD